MKRTILIALLAVIAAFSACQKDIPVPNNLPIQIQDELIMADSNSFVVQCKLDYACAVDEIAFILYLDIPREPNPSCILVKEGNVYKKQIWFPPYYSSFHYSYRVKVLGSYYYSESRYFEIPR